MPLLDEFNAHARTAEERSGFLATDQSRLDNIKTQAWRWYQIHRKEAIVSVLGITVISWGHGTIYKAWVKLFGPEQS